MMQKSIYTIILCSISTILFSQTIVTDSSKVQFEIGNFWVNTVDGEISGMTGEINFIPEVLDESFFEVCIDPTTIDTENEERDETLRDVEYLDVKSYPSICISSESIEKLDNSYLMEAVLNIKGIKKPVEIEFTFIDNTFTGEFEIERKDYNVGMDTGTFTISNTINLKIICKIN
jgi:polyisoprenoid-binding protein YceI